MFLAQQFPDKHSSSSSSSYTSSLCVCVWFVCLSLLLVVVWGWGWGGGGGGGDSWGLGKICELWKEREKETYTFQLHSMPKRESKVLLHTA